MESATLASKELKSYLKECQKVTSEILQELDKLGCQSETHHVRVLAAKTGGTTAATLGTGMAITGLLMAPFTLGTSLIVSSVGAATSVGGAAANLITDLVDHSKKNRFLRNVQILAEKHEEVKQDLLIVLEPFDSQVESLMDKGLTQLQAMYGVLHGDTLVPLEAETNNNVDSIDSPQEEDSDNGNDLGVNGSIADDSELNDEDVDEDPEKLLGVPVVKADPTAKKKSIRKFCFKAGINSVKIINYSRSQHLLLTAGQTVALTGRTASSVGVAAGSTGMVVKVGRALGSTAFRGTMAAVGVIFTSIDIAILVKDWKGKNLTAEMIHSVMDKLKAEESQYAELTEKLNLLEGSKMFVGFVGSVPIFGSNPFPTEALVALHMKDFKLAKNLYGMEFSKNAKWPLLREIEVFELAVGQGTLERFEKSLTSLPEESELEDIGDETRDSNGRISHAEPVSDLEMFSTRLSLGETGPIAIPVFNPKVLEVNQMIIDSFLQKKSYPNFQKLKKELSSSTILQDYENPVPSNILNLMNKVLISYYKYEGYINANKWEFDSTLELLIEHAVVYMITGNDLLDRDSKFIEVDKDKDELKGLEDLERLSDLVDIVITHKTFVDPVADFIWTGGDNNQAKAYATVFNHVKSIFRTLHLRINVWVFELHSVIKDM